jgi:cysteine synthase B
MAIRHAHQIPATQRPRRQPAAVVQHVGNTPLLRLGRIERDVPGCELWAKAEWVNPGGSVKDRAALAIVRSALRAGQLDGNRRLLDASSGNTGISYAMLGAAFGFGVTIVVPANAGPERLRRLRALGAELILTDAMRGMDLAIQTCRALQAREPQRYFHADQYANAANWRAHHRTTGVEILRQTRGRITHFVAGLGTSGTFVGTMRRLRQHRPRVRGIAFIPDGPMHGIEGLKHLPTACRPPIWDAALADVILEVGTDEAYAMWARLARAEGLLVGTSAAAAVAATLRVMRVEGPGVYVTVLPDDSSKYAAGPLFDAASGAPGGGEAA